MMRKIYVLIMAILLPLSVFNLSADEKEAKKISLSKDINGFEERGISQCPIESYYVGIMNSIVTTVWSDLGDVALTVTNNSTGSIWYDIFDSELESRNILTLSGEPGIYEIVYITESGDVYEGVFVIN